VIGARHAVGVNGRTGKHFQNALDVAARCTARLTAKERIGRHTGGTALPRTSLPAFSNTCIPAIPCEKGLLLHTVCFART
jgi:hypothetical protein